jgi:hypothetical protein
VLAPALSQQIPDDRERQEQHIEHLIATTLARIRKRYGDRIRKEAATYLRKAV